MKKIQKLKLIRKNYFQSYYFLKNKNLQKILYAQKNATENIFKNKKIPFRITLNY